jgi:hypothetical protein
VKVKPEIGFESDRTLADNSCLVAQRLPMLRLPAWSTCFLSELVVEILEDLPD